ncbi:hypothetical protein [Rhizobium alvei]|uniref:Uncharacterized protein n=1 Tax=Rhizobium alvei TaxID=1132659 RepID=A0ABT8YSE4_9HYPH|nr:hypothetical protein [Rhizobium alvei]MDO6966486.1 hypothetical protein [Rhizobium alvei]
MSQTTHPGDKETVNPNIELQEFLGFSDLEAELLGANGVEKAQAVMERLIELDKHLAGLESKGLPKDAFEVVIALKKAVLAAGSILATRRVG